MSGIRGRLFRGRLFEPRVARRNDDDRHRFLERRDWLMLRSPAKHPLSHRQMGRALRWKEP
jgi:hypothetical protein